MLETSVSQSTLGACSHPHTLCDSAALFLGEASTPISGNGPQENVWGSFIYNRDNLETTQRPLNN